MDTNDAFYQKLAKQLPGLRISGNYASYEMHNRHGMNIKQFMDSYEKFTSNFINGITLGSLQVWLKNKNIAYENIIQSQPKPTRYNIDAIREAYSNHKIYITYQEDFANLFMPSGSLYILYNELNYRQEERSAYSKNVNSDIRDMERRIQQQTSIRKARQAYMSYADQNQDEQYGYYLQEGNMNGEFNQHLQQGNNQVQSEFNQLNNYYASLQKGNNNNNAYNANLQQFQGNNNYGHNGGENSAKAANTDKAKKTVSKAVASKAGSKAVPSKASSKAVPSKASSKAVPSNAVSKAVPSNAGSKAVPSNAVSKAVPSKAVSKAVPSKNSNDTTKRTSHYSFTV